MRLKLSLLDGASPRVQKALPAKRRTTALLRSEPEEQISAGFRGPGCCRGRLRALRKVHHKFGPMHNREARLEMKNLLREGVPAVPAAMKGLIEKWL